MELILLFSVVKETWKHVQQVRVCVCVHVCAQTCACAHLMCSQNKKLYVLNENAETELGSRTEGYEIK